MSDIENNDEPAPERPRRGKAKPLSLKTPKSNGRPASRKLAAPPEVIAHDERGERLSRRSRLEGGANDFDVPEHRKRPGWDYEWRTIMVMSAPVDGAEMTRTYEGGWRPVSAKDMPELCAPGWEKPNVERFGQMLFTRPMHLTIEARKEDYEIAETQKRSKLEQALASSPGTPSSMPRQVQQFDVQGSIGTAKPAA